MLLPPFVLVDFLKTYFFGQSPRASLRPFVAVSAFQIERSLDSHDQTLERANFGVGKIGHRPIINIPDER
jgi:hypothetical protein